MEAWTTKAKELRKERGSIQLSHGYLNESLGDLSFTLSSFVGKELESLNEKWRATNWMDDCLISNLETKKLDYSR